jgi:hypothetical protein
MLFHSASKLGLDTKRLFRENARLCADEIVSKEMAEFPARTPESRDLRAFDLRESEGPEGFTYHQTGFL